MNDRGKRVFGSAVRQPSVVEKEEDVSIDSTLAVWAATIVMLSGASTLVCQLDSRLKGLVILGDWCRLNMDRIGNPQKSEPPSCLHKGIGHHLCFVN